MRLLSDKEKEIIKQFYTIKNNGGFLYNYFWDQLQNEDLEIDRGTKEIKVVFRTEIKNGPNNEEMKYYLRRIEEIELEVVLISNIMKYLENEGYIICLLNSENQPNQETIHKILPQGTRVTRTFPDKKINELFITYIDKKIIITPMLDDLVKHNFISAEDRKYHVSNRIAIISIVIAFIIGLIPIIQSITTKNDSIYKVELDESSLNKINNMLNNQAVNKEAIHLHEYGELLKKK